MLFNISLEYKSGNIHVQTREKEIKIVILLEKTTTWIRNVHSNCIVAFKKVGPTAFRNLHFDVLGRIMCDVLKLYFDNCSSFQKVLFIIVQTPTAEVDFASYLRILCDT